MKTKIAFNTWFSNFTSWFPVLTSWFPVLTAWFPVLTAWFSVFTSQSSVLISAFLFSLPCFLFSLPGFLSSHPGFLSSLHGFLSSLHGFLSYYYFPVFDNWLTILTKLFPIFCILQFYSSTVLQNFSLKFSNLSDFYKYINYITRRFAPFSSNVAVSDFNCCLYIVDFYI